MPQYQAPGMFEHRLSDVIQPLIANFRRDGRRTAPDFVEVTSGTWDLARWAEQDVEMDKNTETGLTQDRVTWYRFRVGQMLEKVRAAFPNASTKTWRTLHYPSDQAAEHDYFMVSLSLFLLRISLTFLVFRTRSLLVLDLSPSARSQHRRSSRTTGSTNSIRPSALSSSPHRRTTPFPPLLIPISASTNGDRSSRDTKHTKRIVYTVKHCQDRTSGETVSLLFLVRESPLTLRCLVVMLFELWRGISHRG